MDWSLEKIYSQQVRGKIPPRRHLHVLGEAEGDQQALTRVISKKTGDKEEVPVTDTEQEAGKYDLESKPILKLTDQDIELFNMLGYDDQLKVKKYIESHALRKIVTNTFVGKEPEVNYALRLLMSSDLSGKQIENVMQLINANEAVDVDKLKAPGNKKWNDIFKHEDVWEMYKDLIDVGSGKEQKGPGEVALTFLDDRIKLSTKGDIDIDGELYELKLNGGRIADQPAPSQKQMQPILLKYLGEYGRLTPGKKTMSLETFIDRVNQHKEINQKNPEVDDDHYRNLAREVFSAMLDEVHAAPFAELFAKNVINAEEAVNLYKKQSFDWYKNTKKGTDGEWDKLIGINFRKPVGAGFVATTTTGDEFARSNMVKPQIHILRSGAGTREGYVNYYPVA